MTDEVILGVKEPSSSRPREVRAKVLAVEVGGEPYVKIEILEDEAFEKGTTIEILRYVDRSTKTKRRKST